VPVVTAVAIVADVLLITGLVVLTMVPLSLWLHRPRGGS
jgi:uncharacterized protein YqfA (UPF0365 family)